MKYMYGSYQAIKVLVNLLGISSLFIMIQIICYKDVYNYYDLVLLLFFLLLYMSNIILLFG